MIEYLHNPPPSSITKRCIEPIESNVSQLPEGPQYWYTCVAENEAGWYGGVKVPGE